VFVQINISHSDVPIEEFMALEDEFVKATEGKATIRRGIDQIASKVMGMIKEDMPQFLNLEVKSDRTF